MKVLSKILAGIISALALVLVCTSCSLNNAPANDGGEYGGVNDSMIDKESSYTGGSLITSDLISADRKIVKTVRESIQTETYDEFLSAMQEKIAELGGYITSANYRGDSFYNKDTLRTATVTVRIPAEKLGEFTESLEATSIVTSHTEEVNDVTTAYVDVESRISVLVAEETALLEMLESAENVDTALTIRTRLNSVQSDLASLRAQKNTYDSLVAYSTVHLNISEVRRAESTDPTFFEEVGYNFSESLDSIGEGIRAFAVWIIGDILYILIIAALLSAAFFLARHIFRKRKNNKEKGPIDLGAEKPKK